MASRRPEERYGIYTRSWEGTLALLATTPDAGGIGVALTTLDEDQRDVSGPGASLNDLGQIGIHDGLEGRWIVSPFPRKATI